jgi:ABC-2 type transport system ATP-binding protein
MVASLYPDPLPVDEVMQMAGITDLDGRKTTRLSGGQTQRVRAAMALVSNPDLLLLDEPTVALDVSARHEFWTTVRSFASRGKTVLFATHYLEEADAYADRIVLMARGHIVADGPANEIKASVNVRTIRATVPDLSHDQLRALPTVSELEPRGESVVLTCSDSDAALRALLSASAGAHGIEVTGAGLDQAFLQLTADAEASSAAQPAGEPVTEGQSR